MQENFSDNPQRVRQYSGWLKKRDLWVEEQKKLEQIRNFYFDLYEWYIEAEQNSESKEMMVGNGILTDTNDKTIHYPLLLKRVEIKYHPDKSEIVISDSERPSEFCNTIFNTSVGRYSRAVN